MSVRKARLELRKLRAFVAPEADVPWIFITIEGESEAQALKRYGLGQWPEDSRFMEITRDDCGL